MTTSENNPWPAFHAIRDMPPGAERRRKLLDWLAEGDNKEENSVATASSYVGSKPKKRMFPINREHTLSDKDPDLAYLLKRGKLVRVRDSVSRRCRTTYLALA